MAASLHSQSTIAEKIGEIVSLPAAADVRTVHAVERRRTVNMIGSHTDTLTPESAARMTHVVVDQSRTINRDVAAPPVPSGAAIGTVIAVDDDSVICEVQSANGAMRVALPRCHFPERARFGLPISIAVESVNGIRRPVIRERVIETRNDALTSEVDRLLESL